MKPVVFHRDAEEEVREAVRYYEGEGLGLGFRQELRAATERIQQTPTVFTLTDEERGVRRCLLRRFPYSIFFRELDDSLWVAAVVHHSRRPNYRADRQPE